MALAPAPSATAFFPREETGAMSTNTNARVVMANGAALLLRLQRPQGSPVRFRPLPSQLQ